MNKYTETHFHKKTRRNLLALAICGSLYSAVLSADTGSLQRLKNFSLEELADVEIAITGKSQQRLRDIPAAVYVLSKEQIRDSTATNIPDLLRLVPGLHVAQMDANKWTVSSRGFSSRITNKLLVMIDGRSIYSPLFGGVMWDQQNIMLEDIERIEVVRGPGGTVWGANAVNGVINIISKHADDTQGSLASVLIGTEKNIVSLRQGGKAASGVSYRFYAKHRDHEESASLDGSSATDDWQDSQLGFRVDWSASKNQQLTLQGDIYQGDLSERITVPSTATAGFTEPLDDKIKTKGANLIGKWQQTNDEGDSQHLQVYLDHVQREQWIISERRSIFDIDYQYSQGDYGLHRFMFGIGYRYTTDKLPAGNLSIGQVRFFTPEKRTDHLFNAFIQDEIALVENRLWLTVGTKLETNQYTGLELQPNLRLRWKLAENQLAWASISKAIRTPSRAETDGFVMFNLVPVEPAPIGLVVQGSSNLKSETLLAYELGYRFELSKSLMFDTTIFYQDYDDLVSFESVYIGPVQDPAAPPSVLVNILQAQNELEGSTYGLEASMVWSPVTRFNLVANYSYLEVEISPKNSSLDEDSEVQELRSPRHQFNITSNYQFESGIKLSLIGRHVGSVQGGAAYTELDSNLQWQLNDEVQLTLIGRNLLDSSHPEVLPAFFPTEKTEIEREFYIKLDWAFN